MLALYRAGRQSDALDAYSDARRMLVEELGLEPSPELRALESAILRQDASLGLPRSRRNASHPALGAQDGHGRARGPRLGGR